MINILLVDDEIKICEFVKAYLDKEGYNTTVAHSGTIALKYFNDKKFDIIILDRMLPDISGEEICSIIRLSSDIPIIMLTAKTEDDDRLEGFKLGCDDYICKPFNAKELVFRVKSILKRVNTINLSTILLFGNEIEINTDSHSVKVQNNDVYLTHTEYKILLMLASNPNKIYTREELLENVVEGHYEKADRVIDSHIKNLRQKIEIDSKQCKIIQTVYGVGYKFGLQR
ncbi:MAG: response regulator transcription factor [Paraclostridium sp.]